MCKWHTDSADWWINNSCLSQLCAESLVYYTGWFLFNNPGIILATKKCCIVSTPENQICKHYLQFLQIILYANEAQMWVHDIFNIYLKCCQVYKANRTAMSTWRRRVCRCVFVICKLLSDTKAQQGRLVLPLLTLIKHKAAVSNRGSLQSPPRRDKLGGPGPKPQHVP